MSLPTWTAWPTFYLIGDQMVQDVQRTVVVTGGSLGIGQAVCLALDGPGTRVYFNYRSAAEAAENTRQLIKGYTANRLSTL